MRAPSVLLGGLGGDSHSVGLHILKWSLEKNGFQLNFLGVQNSIEDFINNYEGEDFIFMSCMDGHAEIYLKHLPKLVGGLKPSPIIYLGGNPTLQADGNIGHFKKLGVNRIYLKYTSLEKVFDDMKEDLVVFGSDISSKSRNYYPKENRIAGILLNKKASEETLSSQTFIKQREEVLQLWRTGRQAVDLEKSFERHKNTPSLTVLERENRKNSRSALLQARTGVPNHKKQLELLRRMKVAGSNVLSHQVDSLTRNLLYEEAEAAYQESLKSNKSNVINGTPIVNWGADIIYDLALELKLPMQVRHSSRDPRLLAEITLAGGISAFEGGSICYNIPYYKNLPIHESIERWKYVDYLCGIFAKRANVMIHREFFGVLTGTLIPHCLGIATGVLEGILAYRQGVRSISIGIGESGSLVQDSAAIAFIKEDLPLLYKNMGLDFSHIGATLSQHMGAFPNDSQKARELIIGSAVGSFISGPDRLLTKTAVESERIPEVKDNEQSMSLIRNSLALSRSPYIEQSEVDIERTILKQEVEDLITNVLVRGSGDVALGIQEAFRLGELDVPFSPSKFNAGKAFAIRDTQFAIRFAEFGNLPIRNDIKSYHRDKIDERLSAEKVGKGRAYELANQDIMKIMQGHFDFWPLDSRKFRVF